MITANQDRAETNTEKQTQTESASRPTCFVMMPISDVEPYQTGHFRRVYEYIVQPACERAGFTALRADEVNQTNHIVIDVIRNIVSAEMSICDLSARNPNVFYELGVRQAFNKPVTLMKDSRTPRVFDIQGLRDVEYDESLRVDSVETSIRTLAESIENTYRSHQNEPGSHVNSIVQLLGVQAASVPTTQSVPPEIGLVLAGIGDLSSRLGAVEEQQMRLWNASRSAPSLFDFNSGSVPQSPKGTTRGLLDTILDPIPALRENDRVRHRKFGDGNVVNIKGTGRDQIVSVAFDHPDIGTKRLVVSQAQMSVVDKDGKVAPRASG